MNSNEYNSRLRDLNSEVERLIERCDRNLKYESKISDKQIIFILDIIRDLYYIEDKIRDEQTRIKKYLKW